ncbi:hypothetical protein [Nitrososphaera sp.]|uniref:hypothetical protein n=1 Tax=Nitrososphaera sp. TaxID=1971748 RepID=UPI00307ED3A6
MPKRRSGGRRKGGGGGKEQADEDLGPSRTVTGKELSELEELSARLTALVEMLDEKGVISAREYGRVVTMRLHEISKATAIGELDEEL